MRRSSYCRRGSHNATKCNAQHINPAEHKHLLSNSREQLFTDHTNKTIRASSSHTKLSDYSSASAVLMRKLDSKGKVSCEKRSRVIFGDRKCLVLGSSSRSQKELGDSPNVCETSKAVDWVFSSLYKAALMKNIKFNAERNKNVFCEEEVQNAIILIEDLKYQSNSAKAIKSYFKKARNTLKKLLMELMHPELYSEISRIYKTEAETCGLLKYLLNLLKARKDLVILLIKVLQWNVLFTLLGRNLLTRV